MLYIYAAYGNDETGNWETLEVVPLKPNKELYPEHKIQSNDGFGINKYSLKLPSGEVVYLSMAFTTMNNSLSFVVEDEVGTLVNVGTFKPNLETFDPSVLLRTVSGLHLSFMFSNKNA